MKQKGMIATERRPADGQRKNLYGDKRNSKQDCQHVWMQKGIRRCVRIREEDLKGVMYCNVCM